MQEENYTEYLETLIIILNTPIMKRKISDSIIRECVDKVSEALLKGKDLK